ncbi:hypothetical protein [Methylobacterium segetis]|uniref:hypothetical protein n=1 Tax=Methylobacterium segetis TaxID=2488750 RepID=UPI00104DCB88|nr:hypothetical protein [Methylobacterium segetis]
MIRVTTVTLFFGTLLTPTCMAQQSVAPPQGPARLRQVASFDRPVTEVPVSTEGRIVVNFPRWTENVPISVAEVARDSQIKPYPDDDQRLSRER